MKDLIHSLQHLVLEAFVASSSQKRIGCIVSQVKAFIGVGVCSLYLAEKGVIDCGYFSESGDGKLEAFLGTSVFHGGTLVGVIVVVQKFRRKFSQGDDSIRVNL